MKALNFVLLIILTGIGAGLTAQPLWSPNGKTIVYTLRPQVGLGIEQPQATLHVVDADETLPAILVQGASGSEGDLAWKKGEAFELGEWDFDLQSFRSRLYINSAGRVGIGTTMPVASLHINGDPGTSRPALYLQDADSDEGDIAWKKGQHFQIGEWDEGIRQLNLRMIIRNNGRVGIGTENPSTMLDVEGELSFPNTTGDKISLFDGRIGQPSMYGFGVEPNAMYYKANGWHRWYSQTNANGGSNAVMVIDPAGRVGIGASNPNVELTIQADDPALVLRDDTNDNSPNAARIELLERAGGSYNGGAFVFWDGDKNNLVFGTKNNGLNQNVMVIGRSGLNVGIGTTNPHPDYRLSVNGGIRAKEIVVEGGWADFVFEPGYRLRPLAEVEDFIRRHGHLPDIPAATHLEAEGIPLGEMQAKLMQKIEELTLYILEQDRQIRELQGRLDAQEDLRQNPKN